MTQIEEVKEDLKGILSEKRYNHCINVMEKAEELCKIHNINPENITAAALAHDIAKEMSTDDLMLYTDNNHVNADEIEKKQISILHGPVGADICIKKYGFSEEMARAIRIHSTGDVNMSVIDKIVFLADKIEKNRTYEKVEEIRKASEDDLDKAILLFLNHHLERMIKKGRIIHPKSILLRNELVDKFKGNF